VAEKACNRIMSLPLFPEITDAMIEYVVAEFLKVAKND
jgi:dTDP-4-amino-4,6-dideoxygalactose transaminase